MLDSLFYTNQAEKCLIYLQIHKSPFRWTWDLIYIYTSHPNIVGTSQSNPPANGKLAYQGLLDLPSVVALAGVATMQIEQNL